MQTEIAHSSPPWPGSNSDWDTFQKELWVFQYQRSQIQEWCFYEEVDQDQVILTLNLQHEFAYPCNPQQGKASKVTVGHFLGQNFSNTAVKTRIVEN